MYGTIHHPISSNFGHTGDTNKVENVFESDNANNNGTNNVTNKVVGEDDLPQLIDSIGGSHVINGPQLDVEDFTSWKDRFLVYLDGLEHFLFKILKNGPFVPKSIACKPENFLPKPQKHWTATDRKLVNQDKRPKSIIISCLPNDTMKVVIKCSTARETWNDLIQSHEGPSETRDTKIATLRLKFNAFKSFEGEKVKETYTKLKILLNELENKDVKISQAEVNATFVNSLPKKWLSINQTQRANNSIKNISLATYSTSRSLISNTYTEDSGSDVDEDTRSNNGFLADLYSEFHDRALLANQKRFYKRSGRVGATFMAIAEDELVVGKTDARSVQWVKITMKKVLRLFSMNNGDERKHVLGYTNEDLHYVEGQRKNLLSKFNSPKQDLSSYQLLTEKIPGNIVCVLDGRGKRKETISRKGVLFTKDVLFTKGENFPSETSPDVTSNTESIDDNQEPLPTLPKLSGVKPIGASNEIIPPADLIHTSTVSDKTKQVTKKESTIKYVKKKAQTKIPSLPDSSPEKEADSSTGQLLLTLMKEVKELKEHIKHSSDNSSSISQIGSSKSGKGKQKAKIKPCKHCGIKNHLSKDCYNKP
ncbi:hypothetical protein Tco_0078163 [Tanacetum coccineum]